MYGTTIPKSTLWRCQRLLKEGDANLNDDMWSVLPKWMKELAEGNPGTYWSVEHDADTKQFVRAILVLPTANIIRLCGRKITASDMCHSKNDNFEGTYAIGSYQLGSGKNIDLWCAAFACAECKQSWEWIASELKKAQVDDLLGKGYTLISGF